MTYLPPYIAILCFFAVEQVLGDVCAGAWAEASNGYVDQGEPGKAALRLVANPSSDLGKRTFGRIVAQKQVKNSVVYNVLKATWAWFGAVKMTEVDERTMEFEFQSVREKDTA